VVIPTLNEASNLPHVLPFIPTWVHEIIIVDGHSKDNTVEVAKRLCPSARILMQEGRGKGAALRTGFKSVTGDIIVMLDADGSTDPREIPRYVTTLLTGADYAKGTRFVQGGGSSDMTHIRRLGNWGLTTIVRVLFGESYSDLCYGYNAFWSWVVPILDMSAPGFEIETLMNIRVIKARLNIVEVPSFEHERIHGASNLNAMRDGLRIVRTIMREWADWRLAWLYAGNTQDEPVWIDSPHIQTGDLGRP
jgi:glycosyltransferase involved in cell wall biosynthesis